MLNYACQYGKYTDALSEFSREYMAHCKHMYENDMFEMPLMFRHFQYTNKHSRSENENKWYYKDRDPAKQSVIRLNPPTKSDEKPKEQDDAMQVLLHKIEVLEHKMED
jgi:hypothetical protein